jgi:hypothetical protein
MATLTLFNRTFNNAAGGQPLFAQYGFILLTYFIEYQTLISK